MAKLVYRLTREEKLGQMVTELTKAMNAVSLTTKEFVRQYDMEGTLHIKKCGSCKEEYGSDLHYSSDFVIKITELKQTITKSLFGKEKTEIVKIPAFDIRFVIKHNINLRFAVGVHVHNNDWYGVMRKLITEIGSNHPINSEVEVRGDVDVKDVDEVIDKWA